MSFQLIERWADYITAIHSVIVVFSAPFTEQMEYGE